MDWTYTAIMLAAVATGWVLFRRQPRPPDVRPGRRLLLHWGPFAAALSEPSSRSCWPTGRDF